MSTGARATGAIEARRMIEFSNGAYSKTTEAKGERPDIEGEGEDLQRSKALHAMKVLDAFVLNEKVGTSVKDATKQFMTSPIPKAPPLPPPGERKGKQYSLRIHNIHFYCL